MGMDGSIQRHETTTSLTTTSLHTVGADTTNKPSDTNLVGTDTFFTLQLLFFVILSGLFGVFGTVTNIINMVIFVRQGLFSGGSTINLFFLSLADLGVVFTNFLQSIGFAVISADIPNLPWEPFDVVYLAVGWPHTIFIIINRILTAYVAFERCMCVVIPFKVQRLFTPQRSLAYILVIFTYSFLSHVPIYLTHRLDFENMEGTNFTKLVLVFGPNRDIWHEIVYYANFFVVSFLSVITVLVCTIITSAHVTTSKEWRKSVTNGTVTASKTDLSNETEDLRNAPINGRMKKKDFTNTSNNKEKKLVKTIITISVIFLVCYLPELTFIVVRTVDERVRTYGQYDRLAHLMYSITFVAATINSSFNIFVYYNMSSRYKKEFLEWWFAGKSLKGTSE